MVNRPNLSENPYRIKGPALISFSGGRTSGYMLWRILDAYDGKLPDDVHACFANTGKEREETLRFVHECETHWGCKVNWVEWLARPKGKEGRNTPTDRRFALVNHNSASRNGEPFAALIERKSYVPNPVTRFCTMEMKIEVLKWFMLAQGYDKWSNVVGLRADEMHRVFKAFDRNAKGGERWTTLVPMASRAAQAREEDVFQFWFGVRCTSKTANWDELLGMPAQQLPQGFDLGLRSYEGNCDLCFLKGRDKLKRIIRENPGIADWWIEQEKVGRFRNDYSYADLVREVATSPMLPMTLEDDDEFDAECGLWCPGEEAA